MVIRLLLSGLVAFALTLVGLSGHSCACGAEAAHEIRAEMAPDHSCCNAASSGRCELGAAPCVCEQAVSQGDRLPAPEADPATLTSAPLLLAVLPLPSGPVTGPARELRVRAHGARGPPRTGPPLYLSQRALLV